MPISYSFTDHGSIRIKCGNEWVEASLPVITAVGQLRGEPSESRGGTDSVATADANGTSKAVRASTRSKVVLPTTTFVVATGEAGAETGTILTHEIDPDELVDLSTFQEASAARIKEIVERYARSIGNRKTLDINVDSTTKGGSAAFGRVKALIDDSNVGLDAVRLFRN